MESHRKYIIFRTKYLFKSVAPLHTVCHLAYVIPGWHLAKYTLRLPTMLMQAGRTFGDKTENQCTLHLIYR